jgi:tRNA-uridine 2-sulfurtransferase
MTVVVGMSGGVDSSVSAYLMKKAGYKVIGLFMKNWEEKDSGGVCKSAKDYDDVARTCETIGIPYYGVNFCEEYRSFVFEDFLKDCKAGLTPNPDVLCNREIKFKVFLEKALSLGADFLATGHYARVENGRLYKGLDPDKDQSYFLHAVSAGSLKKVIFPVGDLPKTEVRKIAKEAGIPVHDKKDSTGICFIGKRNFKEFVSGYLGFSPGKMVNLKGEVVGTHDGLAYYTIGQRKGLGLGGEGEAWFVVKKDTARNVLIVDRGLDHPALYAGDLIANELTWIDEEIKAFPYRCTAKIRYRQQDQSCTLHQNQDGALKVVFDEPQRAITPGQAVVFYQGDLCLGGGRIVEAGFSYHDLGKALPHKLV